MQRRRELSVSDAQEAMRVLEVYSQFMQLRRGYENEPDPLALADKLREIDISTVEAAHAWLTRLLVDRYAEERITLDTGKFRMPALNSVKA